MEIGRNGILETVRRCSSGITANRKMSNIANNDDVMRGQQQILWQIYKLRL